MVAIFQGPDKPKPFSAFMRKFVDELLCLSDNYAFNGITIPITVRIISVDNPARSAVLATKYYTGFYSCPNCKVKGVKYSHMTFTDTRAELRTNDGFRNKEDKEYHSVG